MPSPLRLMRRIKLGMRAETSAAHSLVALLEQLFVVVGLALVSAVSSPRTACGMSTSQLETAQPNARWHDSWGRGYNPEESRRMAMPVAETVRPLRRVEYDRL